MTPVSVSEAARALGVAPATLYRWFSEGAPGLVRRGYRGRGSDRFTLIDVAAVAAWRREREGKSDQCVPPAMLAAIARLPNTIAAEAKAHFERCSGPHKRALAAELAAFAVKAMLALGDRFREAGVDVPPLLEVPEPLRQLDAISRL